MRPAAVEPIVSRHRLVWEGACAITGVGASPRATHWLSVTEPGDLLFAHGPAPGTPEWTHLAPAPHPPGTILARWEPGAYTFLFHFDRQWDPLVATCTVPAPLDPRLWAALRPHLFPLGRQPAARWESRFYCRGLLHPAPEEREGGPEAASGADPLLRFIRVFGYADHLLLSVAAARDGGQVGLHGVLSVPLAYADLAIVSSQGQRRQWALRTRQRLTSGFDGYAAAAARRGRRV